MPLFLIHPDQFHFLLDLPETGMGYQIVIVANDPYLVFNASIALPVSELPKFNFGTTRSGTFSDTATTRRNRGQRYLRLDSSVKLAAVSMAGTGKVDKDIPEFRRVDSAKPPPSSPIASRSAQAYYRFSAYAHDKRVDPVTGNFLAGTYATTHNDFRTVPSGFAAVGRYALPNPSSAMHVFQVITTTRPSLVGTAAPNFGQSGGGVEVFFTNGATHLIGRSYRVAAG